MATKIAIKNQTLTSFGGIYVYAKLCAISDTSMTLQGLQILVF